MAGDFAVKCDYDDGDGVVGTIYFHGPEKQRFDSVTAAGVPAHIVMFEGHAHAWNDADAEGARYPTADEVTWLNDEDPESLKVHTSNCEPFADTSVFELPEGITFVNLSDVLNG